MAAGGPVTDVTFQVVRTTPDKLVTLVQVQESPVFWGWVFQFTGEMQILSLESLKNGYKSRARKAIDL